MPEALPELYLLGPQPAYASLRALLSRYRLRAPIAVTTAGWETGELEDGELQEAVGGPCVNLQLFSRSEHLFAEDPELIGLLRQRQDELRHLRDVYNRRLDHLLEAARQLLRHPAEGMDLEPERQSAIDMIRRLDREYLERVEARIELYEQRIRIAERPLAAAHRRELRGILAGAGALLIAGGHAAILLNRLKLFGVLEAFGGRPIIAWSGGAMALAEELVFYHDSPPQGQGNPEVLRAGTGLYHDILPLPGGDRRLNLEDPVRVQLFARRFTRFACVVLDEGTVLARSGGTWRSIGERPARRLDVDGGIGEFAS